MTENKSILLVEDDDIDAETVERVVKDLGLHNPVDRVVHGEEALTWLRDPSRRAPGLILLDLNLPVMSGLEFLQEVKGDPELRRIPVVVLTTSRQKEDKQASFDYSVAGYMVKPVDYGQFKEVVRTINHYWALSEAP